MSNEKQDNKPNPLAIDDVIQFIEKYKPVNQKKGKKIPLYRMSTDEKKAVFVSRIGKQISRGLDNDKDFRPLLINVKHKSIFGIADRVAYLSMLVESMATKFNIAKNNGNFERAKEIFALEEEVATSIKTIVEELEHISEKALEAKLGAGWQQREYEESLNAETIETSDSDKDKVDPKATSKDTAKDTAKVAKESNDDTANKKK